MRKKILKILSLTLCTAILLTSLTGFASAQDKYSVTGFTTREVKNPIYEEYESDNSIDFNVKAKTYYALDGSFDINLCTDNVTEIADGIRATMIDRASSVDIYYKADVLYDNNSIYGLLEDWFCEVLKETESSYEGDYLRYVYSGYSAAVLSQFLEGEGIYYHRITLNIGYYTTKAQEEEFDLRLNRVIEGFGFDSNTSQREKLDTIYEYITKNVKYDFTNLNDYNYKLKFTAYAALVNGTAVCQGYATLFYKMARDCGLDARVVVGESRYQNHAWNIAKFGDLFYYLDTTWDADTVYYNYYLKGSDSFETDHIPEPQFSETEFTSKYPISTIDYDTSPVFDLSDGDFTYELYMNKAKITKYNGNAKHIIIPSTLGGYPVEKIGRMTIAYNTSAEKITISEGVKQMEMEAIFYANALKELNLPSSFSFQYERFGDKSLSGYSTIPNYCDKLETITVADVNKSMKVIDGILYSYDEKELIWCPSQYGKETVTIKDGVETIVPWAFHHCFDIKAVEMPNTVKYIGYWAFKGANSLADINISNNCELIGQFSFGGTKLEEIYIPASVRDIMSNAFGSGCALKTITVDPQNQNYYMDGAALCAIHSDGTRSIIDYAVGDSATSFIVPDNISVIWQAAFSESNLEEIIMPDTVISVYSTAFERMPKLKHIRFSAGMSKIERYTINNCPNLASVIVPSSITNIEDIANAINNNYFTIYGESGSAAQSFANNNGIKFKNITEFICDDGHNMKKNEYADYYQYVCTACADKSSRWPRTDIEGLTYSYPVLDKEEYDYTGKPIYPTIVSFDYGQRALKEGIDYEIIGYEDNIETGSGIIRVKGIGDYYGTGIINFYIRPVPIATSKLTATLSSTNGVKLSWKEAKYAEGYDIYYKKSASSSYIYKGTTKKLYYNINGLDNNTEYTFKLVAYGLYNDQKIASSKYKTVNTKTLTDLKAPSKLSLKLYGYDDVKVGWSKVANAKGYYVYYKKASSSKYTYGGKTTAASFKKANLSDGVKYDFKVVPYVLSGGKDILDQSYKTASVYTLKKISTPKVSKVSSSKVKVSWKNVSGESGYQISKATSKSKTSIASTYSTTSGKSKTLSAARGKTYYYKVRAFVKVGSVKIYGPWSKVKAYTLK